MMHITYIIPATKNALSSKMTYSIDSTITILAKLVTYRSLCPENYSKSYYNHYMEQLANTQVFQKSCKNFARCITSLQKYVKNWVCDCEVCNQDRRIKNTQITPDLIHIPEWHLGPEYLMQIDLLPELPPSEVY